MAKGLEAMTCEEVIRELSNYLDGGVAPELRQRMDDHLRKCPPCSDLLAEMAGTVQILSDESLLEVPPGYSQRLYSRVERQWSGAEAIARAAEVPLGIGEDAVPLGSHLIYFWQTPDEFDRGVRFLYPGLRGADHCVVFGHEEATERVMRLLGQDGFSPASLVEQDRLTLLPRHVTAEETLAEIRAAFEGAVRNGAPAIRYLGNLGLERDPLPGAGVDDVLELEAKVTALAEQFPSVVLCMYDVNTLPGRLILKGGFQTHPLAICGDHLVDNPHYIPEAAFLQHLHQAY
jgi:hypothetical protein